MESWTHTVKGKTQPNRKTGKGRARKSEKGKGLKATREKVAQTKGKTRKVEVDPKKSTPNENDNHT